MKFMIVVLLLVGIVALNISDMNYFHCMALDFIQEIYLFGNYQILNRFIFALF